MVKDKLKIAVVIMAAAVILGFLGLMHMYRDQPIEDTVNYTIRVYDNGTATIGVDNIGYVQQLQEPTKFGAGYYLRPGTLIIPGDGNEAIYEYPRKDTYVKDNKEEK